MLGALRADTGAQLRASGAKAVEAALGELDRLTEGARFVLGHNLLDHDLPLLRRRAPALRLFALPVMDTLRLNPIAFPENPYHRLVKDYKLQRESRNDPLADAQLTLSLWRDQHEALTRLNASRPQLVRVHHFLLAQADEPTGLNALFMGVRQAPRPSEAQAKAALGELLAPRVCRTQLAELLMRPWQGPEWNAALAYVLAWLMVAGVSSVMPTWVRLRFPATRELARRLRDTPCDDLGCAWCRDTHEPLRELARWFGLVDFRPQPTNEAGGSLQADIVRSGMAGESHLAILPTGGGKSLCYQLPALNRHYRNGSLTVVISPLQALMKDQVDSLLARGLDRVAALNGLLSMPERRDALERVRLGDVALLYVSPEQLRSRSFLNAIRHREVGAWIVDEAHCLSKWGHDFRPDYLYVGRFIRERGGSPPHIACYTATAKHEVIAEIRDYFRAELGVELKLYQGGHVRDNLSYLVTEAEGQARIAQIDAILGQHLKGSGGAIVYACTRAACEDIAAQLKGRGWPCAHFHAGLTPERKKAAQQAFIEGALRVIVATSAFGMGIDKPDVRLVLHAEIPGSLEAYLQEAGRAGRDRESAHCVLLYDEQDVNRQFGMQLRSQLTHRDIKQILRAIRHARRDPEGNVVITSGELLDDEELELSFPPEDRQADTRVRTAVAWLEKAGFIERNQNRIRVFPASLKVARQEEARRLLREHNLSRERLHVLERLAVLILNAAPDEGLNTDELSDALGLTQAEVFRALNTLEHCGVLANDLSLTAFVAKGVAKSSAERLAQAAHTERALLSLLREHAPDAAPGETLQLDLRVAAQAMRDAGLTEALPHSIPAVLRTVSRDRDLGAGAPGLGSLSLRALDRERYAVRLHASWQEVEEVAALRRDAAATLLDVLLTKVPAGTRGVDLLVQASQGELVEALEHDLALCGRLRDPLVLTWRALLYLHEQEVIVLHRGLSVMRTAMTLRVRNVKSKYTQEHFGALAEHYRGRILQVHVMRRYAELGLQKVGQALSLVADYFELPRRAFLRHWFDRQSKLLEVATTPQSWQRLVGALSEAQRALVAEEGETNTLVLAGPGSGKTRVLVHRIAYLVRVRGLAPSAVIALTFNREAAREIRLRLRELLGDDARRVAVHTYHGFALRLMGVSLAGARPEDEADLKRLLEAAIERATRLLAGEAQADPDAALIERVRLLSGYRAILVDEYQDINAAQYRLLAALAGRGVEDEDARLLLFAVGDDDQNIYGFAGADVAHIRAFERDYGARLAYLTENYRSTAHIIGAANRLIATNARRLKAAHPIAIDPARREAPAGGAWQARDPLAVGRVVVLPVCSSSEQQAQAAMAELARLAALDPSWRWERCAVLAREHRYLQPARGWCELHGVPCAMAGQPVPRLPSTGCARRLGSWNGCGSVVGS